MHHLQAINNAEAAVAAAKLVASRRYDSHSTPRRQSNPGLTHVLQAFPHNEDAGRTSAKRRASAPSMPPVVDTYSYSSNFSSAAEESYRAHYQASLVATSGHPLDLHPLPTFSTASVTRQRSVTTSAPRPPSPSSRPSAMAISAAVAAAKAASHLPLKPTPHTPGAPHAAVHPLPEPASSGPRGGSSLQGTSSSRKASPAAFSGPSLPSLYPNSSASGAPTVDPPPPPPTTATPAHVAPPPPYPFPLI